ncbi:DUF4748 domain-containing protein isoform X2 [Nerophis ophidion]|uniref:DUF4748 domain-containing protein isoform X2 n=1 Tax=Nerophis ophidion TaxID=159077 RepID=UPI002AE09463|nr:DUF4748 domain-containing protein isoform X2 [Nerophis ophidion]
MAVLLTGAETACAVLRASGHFGLFSAAVCRRWSVQTAAKCSSGSGQQTSRGGSKKAEEEEYEGPEYIPLRKAKNPMMPIGYAWMVGLPGGILLFLLVKRQVEKNRLEQMKIRRRMQKSEGSYEGSRYRRAIENAKLDQ